MIPTHYAKNAIHFLTIFLAFVTPLSIALINLSLALILIIFLLHRDLFASLKIMVKNPLAIAALAYVGVYVFGLFYPHYIGFTNPYFHEALPLLALPVLLVMLDNRTIKPALIGYVAGALISALFSYGIILGYYESYFYAGHLSYFTNRLDHAPQMAFAFILTLTMVLFWSLSPLQKRLLVVLNLLFLFNVFLTDGRAGQIGFVLVMALFLYWYFHGKPLHLLAGITALVLFLGTMYYANNTFSSRIDEAVDEAIHYEEKLNTSAGLRIHMWIDSWRLFQAHPLLGTGTSSYGDEAIKLRQRLGKVMLNHAHPHNQYLFSAVQFGIVGLAALLSLFVALFWSARRSPRDEYTFLRIAMPTMFMVIMLSDVYLSHTMTVALFILIAALLYRPPYVKQS
ncbi:MAG: hypothetical protein KU28_00350 [Sulfurovum sp. PC08-66]|nr:MAG: hypothetical protein KU28_00350 [Sulfurovum sp. PC08-66]KIM12420.1 MAG: hypothetical protein KU37_00470 [Sulfuricurvum sp. PC08-66]